MVERLITEITCRRSHELRLFHLVSAYIGSPPGASRTRPNLMSADGADHEIIDGIGVAPDYYLPLTAQDLSTGHDPDIAKALTLLGG